MAAPQPIENPQRSYEVFEKKHWWVRTGRGASLGPFPHPPRENRAYGFHHTTAHAGRTSVGSSFAGLSRRIPPDSHPVSRPTTTASRLRCFPLYAALPRSSGGALLPRVLPPIRHLAYAGFWSLLGAFPSRALPISGFVPARASEGSARVSPSLLPALLG